MEIELTGKTKKYFAEVWLPLALPKALTYFIHSEEEIQPGFRVIVPLKGKKLYTGFVWKIHSDVPVGYEPKNLIDVVDESPYLDEKRMRFFDWLSAYYCCSIGEVILAGVPAAHRLSSESHVQLHPDFNWQSEEWTSEETWFFKSLEKNKKLSLSEISKVLGPGKAWLKKIRQFQSEGKILIYDELVENYKPRTHTIIRFNPDYRSEDGMERAFDLLTEKPDEEALLLRFLSLTHFQPGNSDTWELNKDEFRMNDEEKKALLKLGRKAILIQTREKVLPFGKLTSEPVVRPILSAIQTTALAGIESGFDAKKTVLLMGVTGSGKTEIYINLITSQLEKGKQCLLLLPEIAITIHIVSRLRKVFGESMGVFHSRASLPDKMEVWEGIQSGRLKLVVGVRSAVFLPFRNLGLVITDEEHDSSYKQSEPSPRYHGRDAAIYLSNLHGSDILLGSATPSVESYFKAKSGKWHFVPLLQRFGESQMPEIRYVDMKLASRTLQMKLDISQKVLDGFQNAFANKQQSILFQNRRGYAPYMQCTDCGWIPYCQSCDVSLTLHQAKRSLNCHYCGYTSDVPTHCISCGSVQLETFGYGTEKLEESLQQLLPDLRIARMDQDTTQSKRSYEQILKRMSHHEIDILVGTQMVTKGLDFENVTFVAVFDIDRVLHYPEYRANERTFQLLNQIAGRSGRREAKGTVMVQTNKPYHPVFSMIANGETILFYEQEILHRQDFGFPPFSRLIRITSRHKTEESARLSIEILASDLIKKLGTDMVLGPEAPPIARLRNQFIFHVLIKIPEKVSVSHVKKILLEDLKWISSLKDHKSVQWILDVDPN
jgi:primosomal protein N' (replication factor Y)